MQRVITHDLTDAERMMLSAGAFVAALLGLWMYFAPDAMAVALGYPAGDGVAIQLGGAAFLGYPLALALGMGTRSWAQVRILTAGIATTGAATVLASLFELASGHAGSLALLIMVAGLFIAASAGWILYSRGLAGAGHPDIAQYLVWLIIGGTVLSAVFGVGPLLLAGLPAPLLGLPGHATYLFQLGGAGSLGYMIIGLLDLRSKNFEEIRLANAGGGIFNGLAAIVTILSFFSIGFTILALLVAPVGAFFAIATFIALQRRGR